MTHGGGRRRSTFVAAVALAAVALVAGSAMGARAACAAEPDRDACATKWSVEGLLPGMTLDAAAAQLGAAGFAPRGRFKPGAPRRTFVSRDRAQLRVVLETDKPNAATVLDRVTRFSILPSETATELREALVRRWGPASGEVNTLGRDKGGTHTEVTVWVDHACDLRVAFVARKEQTANGIKTRYAATRIERLTDVAKDPFPLRDALDAAVAD